MLLKSQNEYHWDFWGFSHEAQTVLISTIVITQKSKIIHVYDHHFHIHPFFAVYNKVYDGYCRPYLDSGYGNGTGLLSRIAKSVLRAFSLKKYNIYTASSVKCSRVH